jgi:hypothetical protein
MVEDDDTMVEHDDPTAPCPLAIGGRGPYPRHCRACMNALRPPRPYQVYDYLGRIITSTRIDAPLWMTAIPKNAIAIYASASPLPRL